MQPAGTSQHCPARNVSALLSRVMVISPPSTKSRASKSWQWLVSFMFGRKLAKTGRKPSRRNSASNSVLSIATTPSLAKLASVLYKGIYVNYRERYQRPDGPRREATARCRRLQPAHARHAQRHFTLDDFGHRAWSEVANRDHRRAACPGAGGPRLCAERRG